MSNALLPSSITSAEELLVVNSETCPCPLVTCEFCRLVLCLFKCMKKHLNLFVIFRQTFCSNLY